MPESNSLPSFGFKTRSRKRREKLVGKASGGPLTRSRIQSKDFKADDEYSNISTLQKLKKTKKKRLNDLKTEDMVMMSA